MLPKVANLNWLAAGLIVISIIDITLSQSNIPSPMSLKSILCMETFHTWRRYREIKMKWMSAASVRESGCLKKKCFLTFVGTSMWIVESVCHINNKCPCMWSSIWVASCKPLRSFSQSNISWINYTREFSNSWQSNVFIEPTKCVRKYLAPKFVKSLEWFLTIQTPRIPMNIIEWP